MSSSLWAVSAVQASKEKINLKEGFCMLKSDPRTRPKTFINCFVLNTLSYKARQLRNALRRNLGLDFNIQNQSLSIS